ncbi:MAG: hypothetical protein M3Y87_19920, partial [Myxococcota bacterium]|nr:hypothetical protein [Myxococcota bacterium]
TEQSAAVAVEEHGALLADEVITDEPRASVPAPAAEVASGTSTGAAGSAPPTTAAGAETTAAPPDDVALRRAIDLVAEGRWTEAHREYQALATERPDDPDLAIIAGILGRRIDAACAARRAGGGSCEGR